MNVILPCWSDCATMKSGERRVIFMGSFDLIDKALFFLLLLFIPVEMLHNLFQEDNPSQGNKMLVNKQKFGVKNDTRTCWDISLSFLFPSAGHKDT